MLFQSRTADRNVDLNQVTVTTSGDQRGILSPLKRFQVREDVAHLTWIEAKFRHGRMTGHDALGERFLQIFDGIPLVQRAKGWRDRQWTVANLPNCVAAREIGRER